MTHWRIESQQVAGSTRMAARRQDIQTADSFRNLFEVPALFHALAAISLATGYAPPWLVACAWIFVALRIVHRLNQCTYDKVFHRQTVFPASFGLLIGMWVAFVVAMADRTPV